MKYVLASLVAVGLIGGSQVITANCSNTDAHYNSKRNTIQSDSENPVYVAPITGGMITPLPTKGEARETAD